MPGCSQDRNFSRRDLTGYAQLGTLILFAQDNRPRSNARRGGDSRRGRRTEFEDGVMACSERTTIPAGHLKFGLVETKGVAYTGTVKTDANVCEWAFIPRGLYTIEVPSVEECDMVQPAGDVGHVAESKVFTQKAKEQFVKQTLKFDKHPGLQHRRDLHKRADNFPVLVTREVECGKTDLVSMKIEEEFRKQLNSMLEEDEAEEAEFIEDGPTITYDDEVGKVNEVHQQLSLQDLQQAPEDDEVLRVVHQWVRDGGAPSPAELRDAHPTLMDYRQVFSRETFVIKQGVLYFTRRLNTHMHWLVTEVKTLPSIKW